MSDSVIKYTVLGIDAAWTAKEPSGIALISQSISGWSCDAIAPSYDQFITLADGLLVDWQNKAVGSVPDMDQLIQAAKKLASTEVIDVIAVDMPLSLQKITSRREADRKISKTYGGRGCSVHSPSELRPGPLSDDFRSKCLNLGYSLSTAETSAGINPALIEVYPHTAILELMNLDYRFRYKLSRRNKLWPDASAHERKENLILAFNKILKELDNIISGIKLDVPEVEHVDTFAMLKSYEDAIDALVCAWVGATYLEENCTPYGDEHAAIWVPS